MLGWGLGIEMTLFPNRKGKFNFAWSSVRVHLCRIQSSIPLPPCLPIVLELIQTLFRRLDTMFLQIGLQKNPAPSPSHRPNSNLSILTPIAHRISEYGHGPPSRWTHIAVSRDKVSLQIYKYNYLKNLLY
jgi:hypothetical protein